MEESPKIVYKEGQFISVVIERAAYTFIRDNPKYDEILKFVDLEDWNSVKKLCDDSDDQIIFDGTEL